MREALSSQSRFSGGQGERIDLSSNYRSSSAVLDAVKTTKEKHGMTFAE